MRQDRQEKENEIHVFCVPHARVGVIGPWLIDEIPGYVGRPSSKILNATRYRSMLKNWVFPELKQKLHPNYYTMILQQDGAPPHTSNETIDFFIQELGDERQIKSSRGHNELPPGMLERPPYSPYLTPLNFWF